MCFTIFGMPLIIWLSRFSMQISTFEVISRNLEIDEHPNDLDSQGNWLTNFGILIVGPLTCYLT